MCVANHTNSHVHWFVIKHPVPVVPDGKGKGRFFSNIKTRYITTKYSQLWIIFEQISQAREDRQPGSKLKYDSTQSS